MRWHDQPRRRSLRAALAVGAGLALVWLGGFLSFAHGLPRSVEDMATVTDGAVVLTGGSARLDSGLDLVISGKVGKLFISGVHELTSIEELQRVLRRAPQVFDCCVVLGKSAEDTVGNAAETAQWATAEGYRSLRIVTGAYHMPRSLFEFRRAIPRMSLIPHPVFPDHVKLDDWWRWPGTTTLLASEYCKYIFTLARWQVVRSKARGETGVS
jgi:uncharacterized SAM-binding protein YcdF (DUF218 family)